MSIPKPERINDMVRQPTSNDIDQDFLDIEIAIPRIVAFLKRPDSASILDQDPELAGHLSAFLEAMALLEENLRFVTAGRAAPKYGITQDQFWALVGEQDWSCPICERGFVPPGAPRMNIDHNHTTGAVRGVLCTACNTGLGHFGDSPDRLDAALAYLEERGCYGDDTGGDA